MENERNEQVIFVKDLLFATLYKWRLILIFALAFAMLFGGWGYISEKGEANNSQSQQETVAFNKQQDIIEQEIQRLQTRIDSGTDYLDHSLLMNMNPYEVTKATATISILTEPIEVPNSAEYAGYASSIVNAYKTSLLDETLMEEISEQIGEEEHFLAELITVTNVIGTVDGTVGVVVIHNDAQIAEEILSAIIKRIPLLQQDINGSIAPHSVACHRSSTLVVDRTLITTQKEVRNNLQTLNTQLKEQRLQLAELVAPASEGSSKATLKKVVILALLGGILGAGLVACVTCIKHIFSKKVYSARTLKAWTGVRILSCVPSQKRGNKIDCWLRKLEGRAIESRYMLAAANIKNYCAENGKLLMCSDQESDKDLFQALCNMGVQAESFGYLTEDVAALKALPICSSVLLIVRCGTTRYDTVIKQMQMIADQKKELLGCVVLGG